MILSETEEFGGVSKPEAGILKKLIRAGFLEQGNVLVATSEIKNLPHKIEWVRFEKPDQWIDSVYAMYVKLFSQSFRQTEDGRPLFDPTFVYTPTHNSILDRHKIAALC